MRDTKLFFIAGCQRSGTTLMRLILESHSKVHCFDETEGYRILVDPDFRKSFRADEHELIGLKIPRFSEQLLLESMQDIDYGVFQSFYRREPVIFMVRDCRDVVHSMAKLTYPDGETWLRKYGKRILISKAESAYFSEENRSILQDVELADFPDHLVGALYWKFKTEALFELVDAGTPICVMCYEHLVRNPKVQLEKVVGFLGLSWESSLLSHHEIDHKEIDDRGLAIGGTDPRLAIHADSVRKHDEYFSGQQLQEMGNLISGTVDRLAGIGIVYD